MSINRFPASELIRKKNFNSQLETYFLRYQFMPSQQNMSAKFCNPVRKFTLTSRTQFSPKERDWSTRNILVHSLFALLLIVPDVKHFKLRTSADLIFQYLFVAIHLELVSPSK